MPGKQENSKGLLGNLFRLGGAGQRVEFNQVGYEGEKRREVTFKQSLNNVRRSPTDPGGRAFQATRPLQRPQGKSPPGHCEEQWQVG